MLNPEKFRDIPRPFPFDIEIRRAEPYNIFDIYRVGIPFFKDVSCDECWLLSEIINYLVGNDGKECIVSVFNGKIIGFLIYEAFKKDEIHLKWCAVSGEYQNFGFGQKMLVYAMKKFQGLDTDHFIVELKVKNSVVSHIIERFSLKS